MLKRKSSIIALCVISAIGTAFTVYSFVHLVRHTHEQAVLRDFGDAYEKSSKFPLGLLRAEDALFRFKRVDLHYCSDDFKRATGDYIAAMQGVVDALKAGEDPARFDKPMEDAYARMHRYAGE